MQRKKLKRVLCFIICRERASHPPPAQLVIMCFLLCAPSRVTGHAVSRHLFFLGCLLMYALKTAPGIVPVKPIAAASLDCLRSPSPSRKSMYTRSMACRPKAFAMTTIFCRAQRMSWVSLLLVAPVKWNMHRKVRLCPWKQTQTHVLQEPGYKGVSLGIASQKSNY